MDRVVLASFAEADAPEVLGALAELDVPFVDATLRSAAVPLLNLPDWDRRRAALESRLGARVTLEEGFAVASVVGDGLAGAVTRFLGALRDAGCAPRGLSCGPLRIAAAVPAEKLGEVQRALHRAFAFEVGSR